jgi:hypothetical protein
MYACVYIIYICVLVSEYIYVTYIYTYSTYEYMYVFTCWYSSVGIATRYLDRIPLGARFSVPFQTGPNNHPSSYVVGTRCLSRGQSGRGVALTIHPHLAPRLKKE